MRKGLKKREKSKDEEEGKIVKREEQEKGSLWGNGGCGEGYEWQKKKKMRIKL